MQFDSDPRPTEDRAAPMALDPFAFSDQRMMRRNADALAAFWMAPWRASAVVAREAMRGGLMGWR
ncbi:MAG: hypothetical protein AAGC57_08985 [Pseudomonadota bacterium]